MGTYITPGQSKADTIAEIIAETRPTMHATVGNRLWLVVTCPADPQHGHPEPFPMIALCLITHGGSGYKPMDESMGPYYFDCPARLLDAVPDPKVGYSTSWRAKVAKVAGGARESDMIPGLLS